MTDNVPWIFQRWAWSPLNPAPRIVPLGTIPQWFLVRLEVGRGAPESIGKAAPLHAEWPAVPAHPHVLVTL